MSRKKLIFIAVLILALSLLAMGAKNPLTKSAKGSGEYVEGDTTGFWHWTYSFSVKAYTDGSISGYARQRLTESHVRYNQDELVLEDYEIDIYCLNIFDTSEGRVAAVSGWTKPGSVSQWGLSPYYTIAYGKTWSGDGHYHWGIGSNSPDELDCMDFNSYPYDPLFTANVHIQVK